MPPSGSDPANPSATARPTRPIPVSERPGGGLTPESRAVIEAAVAQIESQFSSYMPHPERVVAACDDLRGELAAPSGSPLPDWVARLLPLIGKRTGSVVHPLFEFLETLAARAPGVWPVVDAMLGAQDGALQRRALDALARAADEGHVAVNAEVIERIAELTEQEGSGVITDEALTTIRRVMGAFNPGSEDPGLRDPGSEDPGLHRTRETGLNERVEAGSEDPAGAVVARRLMLTAAPNVRRMAARVLDLDAVPPPEDLVHHVLGGEAASLLAPYLAFTRATHADLVALVPLAQDAAALESFRDTAQALGERTMGEVVAALGWPRLNLGVETRTVVGVSLSDSFPLLLSPEEAALIGGLPGARRVFDRRLVVAVGGGVASAGGEADADGADGGICDATTAALRSAEPLTRFRSYNVRHADLLNEILDVAPLTRARLERILGTTAGLVEDYSVLFGDSSDRATRIETEALVRVHADLRARTLAALEAATTDPLPMEVCRLVQPFEDPAGPSEIRTMHGLKRYLHQRGLKLAFGLVGTGPKATKTVDLAVVTPDRDIEVGRHIEFVDLEGAPARAPAIPHAVQLVVDAFARQVLHGQPIPSHVRVFCYGTEVHYFARFRNHPAFIRIDYSPPLRGGMIDLQYLGVSNYELDVHPRLSLGAIRGFFERLDFVVAVDATSIHARYDKERAVTLDDLHGRAALLFHLVPYLMDVDWTIGSLQLNEEARDAVAAAWASFFMRWGVLPYRQFLTKDRAAVLQAVEMTPEGVREVRWPGSGPYRDRFTVDVPGEVADALQAAVTALGIVPAPPVKTEDLGGQLSLDAKVLAVLRAAIRRGEIVVAGTGLQRCPPGCFERVHEVDHLAAILESDPAHVARAAHLAQVVPLIERHVRFRTSGALNGCDVQRARVSLGSSVLTCCALRDGTGMARLACAADDEFLWRRRDFPGSVWVDSSDLDVEAVLGMLRRGNVLGASPEPIAADDAALADGLRRTFRAARPSLPPAAFEAERVASGVSAAPGRAAGVARLGAAGRDPRDLHDAVLVAAGLDPKDAPCLFNAAAVVATGGGILSHLGLLAVESGKPAVIIEGRWEKGAHGDDVLVFRTEVYQSREHERGPYRLVERHGLREVEHEIHDGDLVTVDADQSTLALLGHDAIALALHEALRQHAASSQRLERAGEDDVLEARGHHLRTRHQLEKVIAQVTDPALVRFAAEEILLSPAWAGSVRALRDGVTLLRGLAGRAPTADAARSAVRHVTARMAGRVREARAQATEHVGTAATLHDVLALRLAVLRLHESLDRTVAALEGGGLDAAVVPAGEQGDLDRLVGPRLCALRDGLAKSLDDEKQGGGREARREQLERLEVMLGGALVLPGLKARPPSARQPRRPDDTPSRYIVSARDGGIDLAPAAGTKAANLAEVARVVGGEMVPEWFAVTDAAFQQALDAPALPAGAPPGTRPPLQHSPDRAATPAERAPTIRASIEAVLADPTRTDASRAFAIRSLWERLAIPQPIADEVAAAYRALGPDLYVAVRSSASDEDTERASKAGQFDTFLFVRGEASVLQHLKLAWSGLWTERALASAPQPAGAASPHCGVVVQRMVQSRVSGVMQTVNAAGARPLELVINVGLGLGEGVVSGAVAADLVTVAKGDPRDVSLRFRYLTADKRQRVVFDGRFGQGTVRVDTLAHQRLRPALEYPELRELVDVALRVERAYGHPVDIEFGFEDAQLRVLQVRPVPAALAVWRETRERFPLSATTFEKEKMP